jgi:hypothetical protein
MEEYPRMVILVPEPETPLVEVTRTPAALPLRILSDIAFRLLLNIFGI